MRRALETVTLLWLLLACSAVGDGDLGNWEEAALHAFTRLRATKAAAAAATAAVATAAAGAGSPSATAASPLRVALHFDIDPVNFGLAQHTTLLQKAFEAAAYLAQLVQVKTPIVGNLLFTPAEADAVNRVFSSNDVPLSVPTDFVAGQGPGAPSADMVVLVHDAADVNWPCDGRNGFLPSAGSTILWLDTATGRPTLALLVVCAGMFDPSRVDSAVSVITHELIHLLGFSNNLMRRALPAAQMYQGVNAYGNPAWFVASPSVVGWAQQQFACGSIVAVPLEDEGGSGTADSHWEQTLFADDLMVGFNNRAIGVTNLTLSLLEDLGWYTTNRSLAVASTWGARAGCDFVLGTCTNYMQRNPTQSLFCRSANSRDMLCTASGGAGGTCRTIPTSNGCVFVYPTFYCRVGVRTSPSAAGDTGMCLRTQSNPNAAPDYVGCFNVRCNNATASFINGVRCQPGQKVQVSPVPPSPSLAPATVVCPLLQMCGLPTCTNCSSMESPVGVNCSTNGGSGCTGVSASPAGTSPPTSPQPSPGSQFHTISPRRKRRLHQ